MTFYTYVIVCHGRLVLRPKRPPFRTVRRLVKGLQDIQYEERAQFLKLNSLSCKMDKGDMILVYTVLNSFQEGVQWWNFFQLADTSRPRGHSLNLRKDLSKLDLWQVYLQPKGSEYVE